jgi:hypothetical protein
MQSRQPARRVFFGSTKPRSRKGRYPAAFELGESPVLPANAMAFESEVDQPEQLQADEEDRQTSRRQVAPVRPFTPVEGVHCQALVRVSGRVLVHASLQLQASDRASRISERAKRLEDGAVTPSSCRMQYELRRRASHWLSRGSSNALSADRRPFSVLDLELDLRVFLRIVESLVPGVS